MRLILVAIAVFSLAALTGCTDEPPDQPPEKSDKITVKHPNLFLQGDDGQVVCTLEETFGRVRPVFVNDGNTSYRIDQPNINIRPDRPELYDTFVEVQLESDGLVKTDRPVARRTYTGKQEEWVWGLRPAEGLKEGTRVQFRLVINVTRKPKTPDAPVEEIRDIWDDSTFYAKVGPPASRVNAALYASPLCALGGVFTIGVGLRRRKDSPGDELVEVEGDAPAPAARAAAAGSAPEEEEEEVSSTVYAPAQAAPGDGFLVQVFVHLPEQAAALDELAKEADEDALRGVTGKLKKRIRRGTELAFHLQMPGLEVDEPVQTCLWEGEPARIQFGVIVPEDCKPRKLFGTVTVCEGSVPIGHLKFTFKITGEAAAPAPEPVRADMTRYRQAFISYASKDRPEVLKRVQMLNSAKINFFQDLLTLEPGDEWAKVLYEYIDKSDVFFLFWSKAASESEWVRREIEYARKASEDATPGPEIVPVIIEGPPHVPPPAELSFLHFNDKFLYFINPRDGA